MVDASVACWLAPPPHSSDRRGHSHVGHTLFILVDGVKLEVGGAQARRGVVWVHNNVHNIAGKGDTLLSMGGGETRSMCVCSALYPPTTPTSFLRCWASFSHQQNSYL